MVISESVKQKECSVRKAKTVYILWSFETVEMELWCRGPHIRLRRWQKGSVCTGDFVWKRTFHLWSSSSPLAFIRNLPTYLLVRRDQLLLQNSIDSPEDRLTAGVSAPLPLTPTTFCLSSQPKAQYLVASFPWSERAATALTQPQRGAVSVQHGWHGPVRIALGKYSRPVQASLVSEGTVTPTPRIRVPTPPSGRSNKGPGVWRAPHSPLR